MDTFVRFLNACLMLVMPMALGIYLNHRLKTDWRLFGIGTITFIGSQVFHIPFNLWVLNPFLATFSDAEALSGKLILAAILLGLSAGVFEETARYLGYRIGLKNERSWPESLMFGAGHGGIESILLGLLVFYAFAQAVALRNADLGMIVPLDQIHLAKTQLDVYWNMPWYLSILGAVERFFAIIFHISATVLVLQAFRRRNLGWLLLAIVWHTVLDAIAVFAMQSWGAYVTEALIAGLAVIGLLLILRLRPTVQPITPMISETPTATSLPVQPLSPTIENIDDSRYTQETLE